MTPEQPVAVCLQGSPRPHANSGVLAGVIMEELARHGARCRTVRLAEHELLPCLAHEACASFTACPRPDELGGILDVAYAADILVLATPVYYENVSGQLKLFIDRNLFRYSHDEWLAAKAVGLVATTAETGLDDALDAMGRYVRLSTRTMPPVVSLGVLADGPGEVLGDPVALERARRMGRDLAELAGLTPS